MRHPNPDMLVRIAQGDAYGMSCEYIKLPLHQSILDDALKFEHYGRHPTHPLRKGQYTDDTQMSIAVAEVLLQRDIPDPMDFVKSGERILPIAQEMRDDFSEAFVRCFRRDQRKGYSMAFQGILETVKTGADLRVLVKPDSDKNGACMRAVPIGVLPKLTQVEFAAYEQAKITHDTPGGRGSAMIVALMSHYAHHTDDPFNRIHDFVRGYFNMRENDFAFWDGAPVTGPDVGMRTARAVATLLATETSLLGIARKTLLWGGDTDSVLSIAWGIASARMREELPPFFDGGLENGTYGRTFLAGLGERLVRKYHV